MSEYSLLKPYYPYKWCLLILTSLLNINPLYECPPKKKLPGHLIERARERVLFKPFHSHRRVLSPYLKVVNGNYSCLMLFGNGENEIWGNLVLKGLNKNKSQNKNTKRKIHHMDTWKRRTVHHVSSMRKRKKSFFSLSHACDIFLISLQSLKNYNLFLYLYMEHVVHKSCCFRHRQRQGMSCPSCC